MINSRLNASLLKAKAVFRELLVRLRELLDRAGPRTTRFRRAVVKYFFVLFDREAPRSTRTKYALGGLVFIFGAMGAFLLLYALILLPFTPSIRTLEKARMEEPSVVLAADGTVLTRYRRVNREWVPLDAISEHVIHALIATEDHRFYKHFGIDPIRLMGALWSTVKGSRQGGSTITQQLARNMFPDEIGREISLTRKLKEAITALKIEVAFEKDEILEAYLNTVPFYFGAYGIEMAARTYFRKSADNLNLVESATLVGMLKGTYYYNPVRNPERALTRRNVALQQMVKRGYLEESEFETMKDDPIVLRFERQDEPGSLAPHFTEHLRMWLVDWADRNDYNIYRDSLVIHTTIDLSLQQLAERAVDRQGSALQAVAEVEWSRPSARVLSRNASAYYGYRNRNRAFDYLWSARPRLTRSFVRTTSEYRNGVLSGIDEEIMLDSLMADPAFVDSVRQSKTRLEVGFVALDPETGFVKAWVGSREFEEDQYDHVARARRQPGSTFKPFVYARALQEGYAPNDKIKDREIEIPLEGGEIWRPTNAGESVSGREYTLTDALVYSKNTITAQLVQDVGARDVAALARRMGVNRSRLRPVPSLALGTSEVSLLEMVSAYGTIANLGIYREPLIVTRIEDRGGAVLAEFDGSSRRVLSQTTSRSLIEMMRGVVQRGTGSRIRTTFGISGDVAGKTGTTQGSADGWFILMHPNLVAGSWVGFNDPRVTFRTDYWGQGGNNALLVVGDFFRRAIRSGALEGRNDTFPPAPDEDARPNIFTRAWMWIREQVSSVWTAIFGEEEEADDPEQMDTYVARRQSGGVQISLPDDTESIADSLTRLEREMNRLDSLVRRDPGEEAIDTTSTEVEGDSVQVEENEEPAQPDEGPERRGGRREGDGNGETPGNSRGGNGRGGEASDREQGGGTRGERRGNDILP